MRLERPHRAERFGAVRIHELQRILELDGGYDKGDETAATVTVSPEEIREAERDMVVVVPCMNETRRVIEGVLAGIPHECLIVLVSNSAREPVDRYTLESQLLETFCRISGRPGIAVHQRDPGLAAAMAAAGLSEIVDSAGLLRTGKGEAMLVGLALGALSGRRYLGYVDADNFAPGSVNEYIRAYASTLHLADTPYAMVRICWNSKPKMRNGRLFFNRRGRTSEHTNQFLNRLIAEYSGFGTEVVTTGNSGEHAFTMELGLKLRLAGGFAVEPYHFIDLFEQFGGVLPATDQAVMERSVSISQVGTVNPHFHDDRGDDHVRDMRMQALQALYHSPVCPPVVREEITEFLVQQGDLRPGEEPPRERVYPAVGTLALDRFRDVLLAESTSLRRYRYELGGQPPTPVLNERPRVTVAPSA